MLLGRCLQGSVFSPCIPGSVLCAYQITDSPTAPLCCIFSPPLTAKITILHLLFSSLQVFSCPLSSISFPFPLFCLPFDNTCLLLLLMPATSLKYKLQRIFSETVSPVFSQLFSSWCAFHEAASSVTSSLTLFSL